MKTQNELFNMLKDVLIEDFEIEEESISAEAHLYQDLDLDSIDAIDLVVKLRELTGKKIEAEAFKKVRTVDDVLTELNNLLNKSV